MTQHNESLFARIESRLRDGLDRDGDEQHHDTANTPQSHHNRHHQRNVADLMVQCLVQEGVEVIFGIPGEENIPFIEALERDGRIRFVVTRHEQGAGFMALTYAHLTGKPGVCLATLGPGALNLTLPVACANASNTPLVALCAQGNINRIHKESHQIIDLVSVFRPITRWTNMILSPQAVTETMRKGFALAQRKRPAATCIILPEDIAEQPAPADAEPLSRALQVHTVPTPADIEAAADIIAKAKHPIILAGNGVSRAHADYQLRVLSEQLNAPVATTFEGKGVFSDRHRNALGVVGFMRHDYENFAFDDADLIIAIGFSIQQFDPVKINPKNDKKIIHINTFVEDTDAHYTTTLNIMADIDATLTQLIDALRERDITFANAESEIRGLLMHEFESCKDDESFPMKPQRVVYDTRKALNDSDVALVDTGALKMWMARLYPTYLPNTCIIDNSLSTMGWTLPGAIGASLARHGRPVLAVMGDGSFMMNMQEIETAVRLNCHIVILVWVDEAYGLIKWKMDLHNGHHDDVDFNNPDFVKLAESFGAHGHLVSSANDLKPAIEAAMMADGGVHVIACPVDYSENMKLTDKLGELELNS